MIIIVTMSHHPLLTAHNLHWEGLDAFTEQDSALRRLRDLNLVKEPALLDALDLDTPGIHTLVGGRQVGKSTLLKLLMRRLLTRDNGPPPPENVCYLTCEPIVDAEHLRQLLTDVLDATVRSGMCWLLIDEVTYVDGWDRTIKFLADAGSFDRCFVLLTGSDHMVIQDSLKRLPGRRGRADEVDHHLHPLSFGEFCALRNNMDAATLRDLESEPLATPVDLSPEDFDTLEGELRAYHETGGFLTAINDVARDGKVAATTMRVYTDWIRGDVLRLDRNERYLREILGAITDRYGSQITWTKLTGDLSIDHPKTVSDYIAILERIDALRVVPALVEHRRGPAPKKGRKVFFADPFIHRAVRSFLGRPSLEPGGDAHLQRDLEAVFATQIARHSEVYYIKAKSEVDVAWYRTGARDPQMIEVKWSRQVRPEDIQELRRRQAGIVAGRCPGTLGGITVLPAAVLLLRIGNATQSE